MPKAIRVEKTCENCEKTFLIKPSHAHQRFCTRACQNAHEAVHGRYSAGERKPSTTFNCKQCGKSFSYKPGYLIEYRRKYGKDPMYCSVPCSALGRRSDTEERSTFVCEQCGTETKMRRYQGTGRSVYYRAQRFCSQKCKVASQMTVAANSFREGNFKRHVKRHGYVWLSVPSLITGKKHEVLEHRFVMEQHIGRSLLPEETVHHINGDRSMNNIENLELFSSRHGPGQRVIDKVAFAIEMLTQYADFARAAGYMLEKAHKD